MTWVTISGAGTTTATKFFGDALNKVDDMFNGVDISDVVTINTAVTWTFQGSSLKVSDTSDTNEYTILGSELTANRDIILPAILANDTFAVLGLDQTFTGVKQFDKEFTHTVVSVPGDPTTNKVKIYPQALDSNNDSWTVKEKIAGSIVEVHSF